MVRRFGVPLIHPGTMRGRQRSRRTTGTSKGQENNHSRRALGSEQGARHSGAGCARGTDIASWIEAAMVAGKHPTLVVNDRGASEVAQQCVKREAMGDNGLVSLSTLVGEDRVDGKQAAGAGEEAGQAEDCWGSSESRDGSPMGTALAAFRESEIQQMGNEASMSTTLSSDARSSWDAASVHTGPTLRNAEGIQGLEHARQTTELTATMEGAGRDVVDGSHHRTGSISKQTAPHTGAGAVSWDIATLRDEAAQVEAGAEGAHGNTDCMHTGPTLRNAEGIQGLEHARQTTELTATTEGAGRDVVDGDHTGPISKQTAPHTAGAVSWDIAALQVTVQTELQVGLDANGNVTVQARLRVEMDTSSKATEQVELDAGKRAEDDTGDCEHTGPIACESFVAPATEPAGDNMALQFANGGVSMREGIDTARICTSTSTDRDTAGVAQTHVAESQDANFDGSKDKTVGDCGMGKRGNNGRTTGTRAANGDQRGAANISHEQRLLVKAPEEQVQEQDGAQAGETAQARTERLEVELLRKQRDAAQHAFPLWWDAETRFWRTRRARAVWWRMHHFGKAELVEKQLQEARTRKAEKADEKKQLEVVERSVMAMIGAAEFVQPDGCGMVRREWLEERATAVARRALNIQRRRQSYAANNGVAWWWDVRGT